MKDKHVSFLLIGILLIFATVTITGKLKSCNEKKPDESVFYKQIIDSMNREYKVLEKEYEGLKKKTDSLVVDRNEHKKKDTVTKTKIEKAEEKKDTPGVIIALKERIEYLESDILKADNVIESMKQEIAKQTESVKSLKSIISIQENRILHLDEVVSDQKTELKTKDEKINKLEKKNKNKNKIIGGAVVAILITIGIISQ